MTLTVDETPFGFDPLNPGFRADPYSVYRRQRETDPVHHSPMGIWTLTRHADCEAALRDQKLGHGDGINGSDHLSFLTLNPPDHTRLRGLVSRAFTPKVIRELRPRIEQRVTELLVPLRDGGEFDLISGFAYPLPVMVISELIGVPVEDQSRFSGWSEEMARGIDPDFLQTPDQLVRRDQAKLEFDNYFRELIAARRGRPADDLLTGLVAAEQDGDKLDEQELLDILALLLVAGHETTVNLIGNGALALLRNPSQLQLLRDDPSLAPSATEELLRYDSPVQFVSRVALADTTVAGHPVAAGEIVSMILGAANRDPAAFPAPDRLDLTRQSGRLVSFGQGIHFCLGAPLARLEGQLALAGLATALPALELVDEQPAYRDHFILRGVSALHVRA
ncbi:cytochrome P450 [Kutzneria sp. NPDC051319]|uniref:cytochrome P450 n=1 Tax=Kutzneria sp. NPDC051319 TaxID=3155047 RepID=UPI003443549A